MKLAHKIAVNVFCKPEDSEQDILNKLRFLFPFSLEENKIRIKRNSASGFNDGKILIFEVDLIKEKHCNEFLENLKEKLSQEQKDMLIRQINSRLDEKLNFFIRLDKNKLLNENEFSVTDKGNCYHIKISIAAFPAKREKAITVLENYLK